MARARADRVGRGRAGRAARAPADRLADSAPMAALSRRDAWAPRIVRCGAALLAALIVWRVFAVLVEPWDFGMLWEAGWEIPRGIDPYPPLGDPEIVGTTHQLVYPYLAALPFVLFGLLPFAAAALVFLAVSIAAVVGAVWTAGARDPLAVPLVLLGSVTIVGLQIGSLNALFLLGLVLAWRWRDRPWALGVLVGVLVTAKLFLAPLLAWLVLSRRYRATVVAAVLSGALVVLGLLVGPIGFGDYRELLGELGTSEAHKGWSPTALFIAWGHADLAGVATVALAAALLGGAWWGYRRGHDERLLYAAAVGVGLVASPIVWAHYLVLLVAPLLVLGARRATLLWFAATGWLVVLPHHVLERIPPDLVPWWPVAALTVALASWVADQAVCPSGKASGWVATVLWTALGATVLLHPAGARPLVALLWLLLCAEWVYRRTAPSAAPGRLNRRDGNDSGRQGNGSGDQVGARGAGDEAGAGRYPAGTGDRPGR
ncbi:MAG: alpha,2-mannosyltransferase [Actinomycetota bacterium]|jgi:hypothetical protein|nr:alpha,2-mannosyltransferase [Actinomycetota bacterium]